MTLNKILVAFDGSENSFKAVEYVGNIMKHYPIDLILILYVERLPDKDLFRDDETWLSQCKKNEVEMTEKLSSAKENLIKQGVSTDVITVQYFASCKSPFHDTDICTTGRSIGMDILRIREEGNFDTVVIGRRGVSKAEEFLFGSVSTKVVQAAADCTVWVVN